MTTYLEIEDQISKAEGTGIHARWRFGTKLNEEKPGKQLPNGRLQEVAGEVGRSSREIQRRMQFSDEYPTEKEVRHAVSHFGSWHEIVAHGLGTRGESESSPIDYWKEMLDGIAGAETAALYLSGLHPECVDLHKRVRGVLVEALSVQAALIDTPSLRITA